MGNLNFKLLNAIFLQKLGVKGHMPCRQNNIKLSQKQRIMKCKMNEALQNSSAKMWKVLGGRE